MLVKFIWCAVVVTVLQAEIQKTPHYVQHPRNLNRTAALNTEVEHRDLEQLEGQVEGAADQALPLLEDRDSRHHPASALKDYDHEGQKYVRKALDILDQKLAARNVLDEEEDDEEDEENEALQVIRANVQGGQNRRPIPQHKGEGSVLEGLSGHPRINDDTEIDEELEGARNIGAKQGGKLKHADFEAVAGNPIAREAPTQQLIPVELDVNEGIADELPNAAHDWAGVFTSTGWVDRGDKSSAEEAAQPSFRLVGSAAAGVGVAGAAAYCCITRRRTKKLQHNELPLYGTNSPVQPSRPEMFRAARRGLAVAR